MIYQVTAPKRIEAKIDLPASKSISNRALVIRALAQGSEPIENLADCDDTSVIIKAFSKSKEASELIDIKAAGTAMRFLTAYYCTIPGTHIITGTERMKQRPISILVDALRSLGAQIDYVEREGYPPLRITGSNLHSSKLTLPGNISSQYISALLMIGPTLPEGLQLTLTDAVTSLPYIDMTLQLMQDFGAKAERNGSAVPMQIEVKPGDYQDKTYTIENDWSAASYWYEMVALSQDTKASVTLPHLYPNSTQGDWQGRKLFAQLGVQTEFTAEGIQIHQAGSLPERLDYSFREIPDLAQTFVVTCCLLDVPFRFTGLHTLRIKETDRISALINELRKLGYVLEAEGDEALRWDGKRCTPEQNPVIATYDDHRMAMAFAPAAIRLPHIMIEHPEVVTKSYPRYWEDLQKAGFKLE